MACSGTCDACGNLGLTVRAAGGEVRRCIACVRALEFITSGGRSWRGFLAWRVGHDDRLDDRVRSSPGTAEDVPQFVFDAAVPSLNVQAV